MASLFPDPSRPRVGLTLDEGQITGYERFEANQKAAKAGQNYRRFPQTNETEGRRGKTNEKRPVSKSSSACNKQGCFEEQQRLIEHLPMHCQAGCFFFLHRGTALKPFINQHQEHGRQKPT